MLGKIEIDEARKSRLIDKAGRFGDEWVVKYGACAPATFAAICEAFKAEGIELFSPETQEVVTQGMMGLHAGIGETGVGTCGGVLGSAFAVGPVVGVTTKELIEDTRRSAAVSIHVVADIMDRFEETYGATDCLKLRYNRIQRALDFLDPDAMTWAMMFGGGQPAKCGMGASCYECGRDQGMPSVGARWGAVTICDLLNLEPEERKTLPPRMANFDFKELMPKIQKVTKLMDELGLGYPNEKISWREYRTLKLKGKKGVEESRPCGVDSPKKEEI